jgi:A/G-specific adenine glycosylase
VKRGYRRLHSRLLRWYAIAGRTKLPWRIERKPYYALVSEFMAQQTQIERVVPKFEAFVRSFPDVETLARASTASVLRAWRGLGYNVRAVRLKRAAETIVRRHGGAIPPEREALEALDGIGPYTAAAIRAFAFGEDDAPIDTNVRRVVGRLFFGPQASARLAGDVERTARDIVPRGNAHDWFSAIMDLGSTICTARSPKCLLCPLQAPCVSAPMSARSTAAGRRAARRTPASRYEATTRYARGRLIDRLRDLPPGQRISLLDLHRELEPMLGRSAADVRSFVAALEKDGLVTCSDEFVALAE